IYILYAIGYVEIFVSNLINYSYAYRYIAPAVISTIILIFIPFLAGIGLSFFEHNHGEYTFVGLSNYIKILTSEGRRFLEPLSFYYTFLVTILWTAANLAIHVSLGLFLALILKNPLLRLKEVYRVILILPWAIPNYITALIWKGMFHKQFGVINELIGYFGIEEISWFSSFSTAFTANLVTNSWLGFPFMMVISLGALQSIPQDIYEAADIEGASRWQKFRKITLPLLKPALFPAIILGSIWTFNMFNIIYLVSGGEPSGATDILIVEAYRWAFERGERYGYAAAYSTIIFLILLGYSLVTNKYSKATENIY
ncbi:MAG: sugar ABC transporter permease, partial [Deltaproteobacteria bacterium]|nr:sugar ABC transporter permease [Deltaproteobacteria bacterium]